MIRIQREGRQVERGARQRRHLTGNAHHRQTVRPVRGDRELEHGVIKTQARRGCSTRFQACPPPGHRERQCRPVVSRPSSDREQIIPLLADTPQFTSLDGEIDRRKHRSDPGDRHMNSSTDVGGAADDLERLIGSDINAADTEFVRIGMFLPFEHIPTTTP